MAVFLTIQKAGTLIGVWASLLVVGYCVLEAFRFRMLVRRFNRRMLLDCDFILPLALTFMAISAVTLTVALQQGLGQDEPPSDQAAQALTTGFAAAGCAVIALSFPHLAIVMWMFRRFAPLRIRSQQWMFLLYLATFGQILTAIAAIGVWYGQAFSIRTCAAIASFWTAYTGVIELLLALTYIAMTQNTFLQQGRLRVCCPAIFIMGAAGGSFYNASNFATMSEPVHVMDAANKVFLLTFASGIFMIMAASLNYANPLPRMGKKLVECLCGDSADDTKQNENAIPMVRLAPAMEAQEASPSAPSSRHAPTSRAGHPSTSASNTSKPENPFMNPSNTIETLLGDPSAPRPNDDSTSKAGGPSTNDRDLNEPPLEQPFIYPIPKAKNRPDPEDPFADPSNILSGHEPGTKGGWTIWVGKEPEDRERIEGIRITREVTVTSEPNPHYNPAKDAARRRKNQKKYAKKKEKKAAARQAGGELSSAQEEGESSAVSTQANNNDNGQVTFGLVVPRESDSDSDVEEEPASGSGKKTVVSISNTSEMKAVKTD